jgi:hypothetical protein
MASSRSDGGAPGEAQSSISPKMMPRTPSSFAGVAQLPEHAIDLVGLGAGVFKKSSLPSVLGSHGVPRSETRMLRQPP